MSEPTTRPRNAGRRPRRAVLAGLALVLTTAMGCSDSDDLTWSSSPPSAAPSPVEVEASADPAPAAETAEVPDAAVPRLVGLTPAAAERRLERAGLVVGEITRRPSAKPVGTVLEQGERVGRQLLAGSAVTVVLAAPYPRVPGVVGDLQRVAARGLRMAGFQVRVTRETRPSGREGEVIGQSPAGRSRIRPGSSVEIVVAHVVKPVAPPAPTPSCTDGYTPCLPPASDYDCAGGSGDGPAYTGPVRVSGSDPYDLDRDGDGLACES